MLLPDNRSLLTFAIVISKCKRDVLVTGNVKYLSHIYTHSEVDKAIRNVFCLAAVHSVTIFLHKIKLTIDEWMRHNPRHAWGLAQHAFISIAPLPSEASLPDDPSSDGMRRGSFADAALLKCAYIIRFREITTISVETFAHRTPITAC